MATIKEKQEIEEISVCSTCTRIGDNVGVLCTVGLGTRGVERFYTDEDFESYLHPGVYGLFFLNTGFNEPVVDKQLGNRHTSKNFTKAQGIVSKIVEFHEGRPNATAKGKKTTNKRVDLAEVFIRAKQTFAKILTLAEAYKVEGKTLFDKLEEITKLPIQSERKASYFRDLYSDYMTYLEPLMITKQIDPRVGHKVLTKTDSGTDLTFLYVITAVSLVSVIYLMVKEKQGFLCYEVEKR